MHIFDSVRNNSLSTDLLHYVSNMILRISEHTRNDILARHSALGCALTTIEFQPGLLSVSERMSDNHI